MQVYWVDLQTLPHQLKVFKFKEEWGLQQMDLVHLEVLIFKQMRLQRILFEVNNTLEVIAQLKIQLAFQQALLTLSYQEESLGLNQMVILIGQVPTFAHTFYKGSMR